MRGLEGGASRQTQRTAGGGVRVGGLAFSP